MGEQHLIKNFAGPPILKDEVRKATRSIRKGKSAEPDNIAIEMTECLYEF